MNFANITHRTKLCVFQDEHDRMSTTVIKDAKNVAREKITSATNIYF